MDKKELKNTIKEIVRESLLEIFAEMHLESIVKNVVKEQTFVNTVVQKVSRPIQEQTAPAPAARRVVTESVEDREAAKQKEKEALKKRMGISEDEWKNIYSTVDPRTVAQVASSAANENPELVSEEKLKQTGLYRDYSKFI
jgi:hypothetical protein